MSHSLFDTLGELEQDSGSRSVVDMAVNPSAGMSETDLAHAVTRRIQFA